MGATPSCSRCCNSATDGPKLVIRKGRSPAPLSAIGEEAAAVPVQPPHGTLKVRSVSPSPPSDNHQVRRIGQQHAVNPSRKSVSPPSLPALRPETAQRPSKLSKFHDRSHEARDPLSSMGPLIPPPALQAQIRTRKDSAARGDDFSIEADAPLLKKRPSGVRRPQEEADNVRLVKAPSTAFNFTRQHSAARAKTVPEEEEGTSGTSESTSSESSFTRHPSESPQAASSPSRAAQNRAAGAQFFPPSESPLASATPTRVARERVHISHVDISALGGGCYLQYTTVGGGILRTFWSKTYPEGAINIAFLKPAKEPPAFKFKGETRKQDLVKGVQRDKNLLYQGWVSFAKLCKQNEAQLTLLDGINEVPAVSIFFVDGNNRIHQVTSENWFSLRDAEAVAAMSAGADALTGITTLPPGMFCQMASKVGAALNL